ncbi:MAG: hypothetical protein GAK38_04340 [Xylophilus sp.]|nr:MAG: hypothetical protein GAK38_04340 [Xylophilus sp.]
MRVERNDDGVFLSATVRFDLPPLVEDALVKGIPMFFVAEAEVVRERWYWYDQPVASAARYMRLSYQPLTRRWRLQTSPTPIGSSGLGVTLGQTYEDVSEVVAAVQRISRWKISDTALPDSDAHYSVDFRFRLDVTQMPRPFQFSAVGRPDWNLSVGRSMRLTTEPAR